MGADRRHWWALINATDRQPWWRGTTSHYRRSLIGICEGHGQALLMGTDWHFDGHWMASDGHWLAAVVGSSDVLIISADPPFDRRAANPFFLSVRTELWLVTIDQAVKSLHHRLFTTIRYAVFQSDAQHHQSPHCLPQHGARLWLILLDDIWCPVRIMEWGGQIDRPFSDTCCLQV